MFQCDIRDIEHVFTNETLFNIVVKILQIITALLPAYDFLVEMSSLIPTLQASTYNQLCFACQFLA